MMPETSERLSKRQQAEAVVKWERDSKIHADARKASDIPEHVPIDEISRKDYKDLIEAAVQEFYEESGKKSEHLLQEAPCPSED